MEEELTPYIFPIKDSGSLSFCVDDTEIKKATLMVNDITLSIIYPTKGEKTTNLDFFGDKPFHTGLLYKCDIKVTLFTDEGMPSLIIRYNEPEMHWTTADLTYIEKVTVGSNSGLVTMDLVYTPSGCGYATY